MSLSSIPWYGWALIVTVILVVIIAVASKIVEHYLTKWEAEEEGMNSELYHGWGPQSPER